MRVCETREGGVFLDRTMRSSVQNPTPRSNWILQDKLLCGDKPHENLERLCVHAKCDTFVNLMQKIEAPCYRDGVRKWNPSAIFDGLPIPDQNVADDFQVDQLVQRVLKYLEQGRVVYIHCRGGHGRTGTVCSLLLGRLHGLNGPSALSRFQQAHDTRIQAVFRWKGDYCCQSLDGECAIALFPIQRAQVIRLLGKGGGWTQELAAVSSSAPSVIRSLSDEFGSGANNYSRSTLEEWREYGLKAAEAIKIRDYGVAIQSLEMTIALRPDWEKGHTNLRRIKERVNKEAHRSAKDALVVNTSIASMQLATSTTSSSTRTQSEDLVVQGTEKVQVNKSAYSLDTSLPQCVLLVGLPGAGKSTFASSLVKSKGWIHLDSDILGGPSMVEKALHETLSAKGSLGWMRVIIDCCNIRVCDRKRFRDILEGAKKEGKSKLVAVYFAVDEATCIERVAKRADHPSIPYGCGRPAILSMSKALELPPEVGHKYAPQLVQAEGFKWITLRTSSEADDLLNCWGAAPIESNSLGLFKFPRTHHVLNTGGSAVSRDDLVMPKSEASSFFDGKTFVVAEEKVDGANLGFSLTRDHTILCQNRSHYINPQSHTQFRPLAGWLEQHSWALCQLLEPEHEILFGEWLVARHSVAYTKLPAYFMAFDIFDKRTRSFVTVEERDRRLLGLGIPSVRTLVKRTFSSEDDLLSLLEERSAYTDGKYVEGAYLRIEGDGKCIQRGKIVRPDFVQHIDDRGHWINAQVVKNGVRPDLWDVEKS